MTKYTLSLVTMNHNIFFYYACGILLDSPPEFMQCQKYVDFLLCPHCVKKKFHKGHVYLMEKATLYFK